MICSPGMELLNLMIAKKVRPRIMIEIASLFFKVKLTILACSPIINGRSLKCFFIPAGSSTQLAVDFDCE